MKEIDTTNDETRLAFMPSVFVMCPLPARSVKGNTYRKRVNKLGLEMVLMSNESSVPSGITARQLLMLFTTAVVKAKKRKRAGNVVYKYTSIREIAEILGIRSEEQRKEIKKQIRCYETTMLTYKREKISEEGQAFAFENIRFFNRAVEIDNKVTCSQGGILEFSPEFEELVNKHAIPVDYEVYRVLGSALEKDLYVWLLYRNNTLAKDQEIHISPAALLEQFGTYKNQAQNYARIKEALGKIVEHYWNKVCVSIDENGVTIKKAPMYIPTSRKKYIPLITG